jgi:hypothetical protein
MQATSGPGQRAAIASGGRVPSSALQPDRWATVSPRPSARHWHGPADPLWRWPATTIAELETAVRERAHVIAIVFDNGRYGTIWRHQERRGAGVGLGTTLGPIDFAAAAEAFGALGLSVGSDEEFEPALRQALEAGRPALLHLALDPRWTTPDGSPEDYDRMPSADTVEVALVAETEAEVEAVEALVAEVEAVEAIEAEVEAVEALEVAVEAVVAMEAAIEAAEEFEAAVEAVNAAETVDAGEPEDEAPATKPV